MPKSRYPNHYSCFLPVFTSLALAFTYCFSAQAQLMTAKPATPTQTARVGDKWGVVIGVSQFADQKVPQLKYSAKDATDFYNYLIDPASGHFTKDHVKLLVNEDATKVNIMDALGDSFLPHAAAPDDLVVIYLSTHGSPAGADIRGVNYVVAYDTQVDKLFATGIEMKQLLRTIKERVHTNRIVLLMDTCYSGAGVEGGHKGLVRTNVDTQEIAQGIGSLVISSSSPNQRSWESDQLKNSYFTKYLIDALKSEGGKGSIDQAFASMKDRVQSEVLRDKGEMQTPIMAGAFTGPGLVLGVPPSVTRSAPYAMLEQAGAAPASQSKMLPGTNLVSYSQHMQLANQLIDQNKLWDAAHELEQATKLNPTSVEAFLVSADVYDAQKRFAEALESAKRAVINDQNSSRAHEALARAYLRTGEVGEALRQAQQAITLDPGNSMAHNLVGFIQERKFSRTDQAEQEYRKALELNPVNTRALINLGLLKQASGDSAEAEQLFRKAIASNSEDWEAHYALGRLLRERGKLKEAETDIKQSIKLDPSNYKLHSELGNILATDKNKLEEAEREFRKAIELAADKGDAHNPYANFLANCVGRVDEAEGEFRKAIELDPHLDDARVGLGNLLVVHRKTYDEADKQFRKALEINPRNGAANVGIARVYSELYKNYTGAEQELRKALRLNPSNSLAHCQLGLLLSTHFQRFDEAKQEFDKAIKADPSNAEAHYQLGLFLINQQKAFDQGLKEFEKAVEIDPSESRFQTSIGSLLIAQYKKYKEAETYLRKAIELNVADAQAHYHLGLLLIEKLGQRKLGDAELHKAYQLDSTSEDFKRAYERYCR